MEFYKLNKALGGGEEIYIHYGARSNGKFLLHNGFVPNVPNPDDFYELKIGLPRSSHDYRAKLQYLAQKSIVSSAAETNQQQSSIFSFQLKPNPNPDAIADLPLFHFARAFIANSEIEGTFGSLENDNKAKKFLMDRIRLLLHCYAKNGSLNADPIDVAICRLKESEIAVLNAYLKCLEP